MSEVKKNVVMIADDNAFVRFIVKRWLGTDAQVIEVATGNDVVSAYERTRPDIVFLDIHMPGKNGKDVLRNLMQIDRTAYVVMVSSDSVKSNVLSTAYTGAAAFISKPFTRETLEKYYVKCPTVQTSLKIPPDVVQTQDIMEDAVAEA